MPKKKNIPAKVKKRVVTKAIDKVEPQEDKIARVMREFKEGKLRSPGGKPVTDKAQAIAIAMSEAGISSKSVEKAEALSKIRLVKKQAEDMIQREIAKDEDLGTKLVALFSSRPQVTDADVHKLADLVGMDPSDVENRIYFMLTSFFRGGDSKGVAPKDIDPEELRLGVQEEAEHTDDPAFQRKIAIDHLTKDPEYYSKLKGIEGGAPEDYTVAETLEDPNAQAEKVTDLRPDPAPVPPREKAAVDALKSYLASLSPDDRDKLKKAIGA